MAVQLDIRGEAPKGNWVARNLRLMNNDSKELFPRTPAEAKQGKFDSLYTVDYHNFPTEVFLEGLAPKGQQPERETIRDVLFGQSPTSTFSNWRIPKRISGECEDARIGDHIGKVPPEKIPTPPALIRQSTLPAIPASRSGPKVFTPKPRVSASDPALKRAKTTLDMPSSRSVDTGGRLKAKLTQWQERVPDVDIKLLQKVIRLQEQQQPGSRQSLRGTLLPTARRTVERWMDSASEEERQVALQFFTSLAGGRLMGGQTEEQGARLKEVVGALQGTTSRWVAEGGLSPRGRAFSRGDDAGGECSQQRLRYLSLLDEDTRRDRWMHTTWHHLPNYRLANPVNNWSSHYVRPHQAQHRHFVIHPDWPPV